MEEIVNLVDTIGDVTGNGMSDRIFLRGRVLDSATGLKEAIDLMIIDGKNLQKSVIEVEDKKGYDFQIILGNFTSGKKKDILITRNVKDKYEMVVGSIYTYDKGQFKEILDSYVGQENFYYDVIYMDYYKVRIISKNLQQYYIIDISSKEKKYLDKFYDENGKLIKSFSGTVSKIISILPFSLSGEVLYGLLVEKKIFGEDEKDILGYIHSVLVWSDGDFYIRNQRICIDGTYLDVLNKPQVYSDKKSEEVKEIYAAINKTMIDELKDNEIKDVKFKEDNNTKKENEENSNVLIDNRVEEFSGEENYSEEELLDIVKALLPKNVELISSPKDESKPLIIYEDLDGDGTKEIVAFYEYEAKIYVNAIKFKNGEFKLVNVFTQEGYGIKAYADFITNNEYKDLVLAFKLSSRLYKLYILHNTEKGLKNLLKKSLYLSDVEVYDMDGDGKAEIAIWIHDTGKAYYIKIYKWKDGKLLSTKAADEVYFKKVVEYYEGLIDEVIGRPIYLYHLASAEQKARMYDKALEDIEKALKEKYYYPSKGELLKLKDRIKKNMSRNHIK